MKDIIVTCPHCRQLQRITEEEYEAGVECRRCGRDMDVHGGSDGNTKKEI